MARAKRRTAVKRTPRKAKETAERSNGDQLLRKECIHMAIHSTHTVGTDRLVWLAEEIYAFILGPGPGSPQPIADTASAKLFVQTPEDIGDAPELPISRFA